MIDKINGPVSMPRQVNGGFPLMLSRKVANTVLACCQALLNLKVKVPTTDGVGILNQQDAKVDITEFGIVITMPPQQYPGSAGGSSSSVAVGWYRVKRDEGSSLLCHTWDGTTEGSSAVYIAKDKKLRQALTSETKNGATYSYSYALNADSSSTGAYYLVRTISGSDGSAEVDDIDPPYLWNDEIYAITIPSITLDGNTCTLIDMNISSRAWASR